MADFWRSSGFHLVRPDENGWMAVTEDFLRAYYTRPEIHPVEESCEAEHRLFEALMAEPFRPVTAAEISAVADPDARESYRIVLNFRDRLLTAGSIEGGYLALVRGDARDVPPVFLDQLVHLILRNALDGVRDPMRLRAAELFFREQTVSADDGRLMLADQEIVEAHAESGGMGALGQLLVEAATPMRQVALDVLDDDNRQVYWDRSDRFDTVVDFRFTQPANDAFARVLETWLVHLTGMNVRIQPVQSIRDERWSWHVGLDAEAMRLLNALYKAEPVGLDDMKQIVALYVMEMEDQARVLETMRGKPVYLGLCMTRGRRLRMKPQNLITNLPLKPDM